MADWFVDQRIVCIDDSFDLSYRHRGQTTPIKDSVYTVRWVGPFEYDGEPGLFISLRLREIVNPPWLGEEVAFYAHRFRPVIIPEADLAVFEAILRGVEKREVVEA